MKQKKSQYTNINGKKSYFEENIDEELNNGVSDKYSMNITSKNNFSSPQPTTATVNNNNRTKTVNGERMIVSKFAFKGRREKMEDYIGNDLASINYSSSYGKIFKFPSMSSSNSTMTQFEKTALSQFDDLLNFDVNFNISDFFQNVLSNDLISPRIKESRMKKFERNNIAEEENFDDELQSLDNDIGQMLSTTKPDPSLSCDFTDVFLFSIFDGHGGYQCAKRSAQMFNNFLLKKILQDQKMSNRRMNGGYVESMKTAFEEFHDGFCHSLKSGSTASVCLVCQKEIIVASLGDSQVLVYEISKTPNSISSLSEAFLLTPIFLSQKHNTENKNEINRLKSMNIPEYHNQGDVPRLKTGLAVTRALGDTESEGVLRVPEVFQRPVDTSRNCYLIIMATDGLWERLDEPKIRRKIYDIAHEMNFHPQNLQNYNYNQQLFGNLAISLVKYAFQENSQDNITCQTIFLF